jgi:MOSC domain-containing protein YiiM
MSAVGATGRVESVNVSEHKGTGKTPVEGARVLFDRGLEGDAHAGDWHRQVSLLSLDAVDRMRDAGADVVPGAFGENLTVSGIDLLGLPLGSEIEVGSAVLRLSQHGKVCHDRCAIYQQVGDCVMPREGVFAVVIREGEVEPGDKVRVSHVGDGSFSREVRS